MNIDIQPRAVFDILNLENERGFDHSFVQFNHDKSATTAIQLQWEEEGNFPTRLELILRVDGTWSARLANVDLFKPEE